MIWIKQDWEYPIKTMNNTIMCISYVTYLHTWNVLKQFMKENTEHFTFKINDEYNDYVLVI